MSIDAGSRLAGPPGRATPGRRAAPARQPLDRVWPPSRRALRPPWLGDQSAVSSIRRARADAGRSRRGTRALNRPSSGAPSQPHDLVVIELGQLAGEAGDLGVLVDLRLPAVGDRRRSARRRRSDRDRAVQRRGRAAWPSESSGASGPHSADQLLERARRPHRSRCAARSAAPHSAATSSADDEHVAHRRAGLQAAGERDHRDAVGARGLAPAGRRWCRRSAARRARRPAS